MADFYEDTGKTADDLFSKGFPVGGLFKVSTETKTSNGVTFVTNASRSVKKGAEVVEATVEPKFNWSEHDVEVTSKFTTSSNYEVGVSKKNLGVEGSKVSVTATQTAGANKVKLGLDFRNDQLALKSAFEYPIEESEKNPAKATVSVIAKRGDIAVGPQIVYRLAGENNLLWNVKASYSQPSYQAVGFYNHGENHDCGVSFFQKVTNALKFAASFTVDRNKKNPPSAQLVSDYQYAEGLGLKHKLTVSGNSFRLGAAISQKFTSNATVTVAADLNALELLGSQGGDAHSFGMEVKLA